MLKQEERYVLLTHSSNQILLIKPTPNILLQVRNQLQQPGLIY
jgi:hypothetical protein